MNPSRMDRRLTLQELAVTRSATGATVEAFSNLADVWAEKVEDTGREGRSSGALHAMSSIVFRIHYRAGLTSKCRVVYEGATFELTAPPVDEGRRVTLLLGCKAVEGSA